LAHYYPTWEAKIVGGVEILHVDQPTSTIIPICAREEGSLTEHRTGLPLHTRCPSRLNSLPRLQRGDCGTGALDSGTNLLTG